MFLKKKRFGQSKKVKRCEFLFNTGFEENIHKELKKMRELLKKTNTYMTCYIYYIM